jgi:hypothetical protein
MVFERVVHDRRAVQPLGLARVRDSDGRAKFVNAGSVRLGDALDRYGESRRAAILQLPAPRVVGQGGIGTQRP